MKFKKLVSAVLTAAMILGSALPVSAQERAGETEEGLLLHYDFSKTEGNIVKDSSGNNHDGSIKGDGWQVDGDTLTLPGGAYGSNAGYVELPTGMFDNQNTLTISLWLKNQTGANNYAGIFFGTTEALPTGYWILNPCNPAGDYKSVITDSFDAGAPYNTEAGISPTNATKGIAGPDTGSAWAMYTTVIEPGSLTAYYNGTKIGTVKTNRTVSEFGQNLVAYIGKSSYHDMFYKGGVKDVKVYTRALSEQEVSARWESTSGVKYIDQLEAGYYLTVYSTTANYYAPTTNIEQETRSVYMAVSKDGKTFDVLNNGGGVIFSKNTSGTLQITEPRIFKDGGKFKVIAQDFDSARGYHTFTSEDGVHYYDDTMSAEPELQADVLRKSNFSLMLDGKNILESDQTITLGNALKLTEEEYKYIVNKLGTVKNNGLEKLEPLSINKNVLTEEFLAKEYPTATATYTDGSVQKFRIDWSQSLRNLDASKPGTYTITGNVVQTKYLNHLKELNGSTLPEDDPENENKNYPDNYDPATGKVYYDETKFIEGMADPRIFWDEKTGYYYMTATYFPENGDAIDAADNLELNDRVVLRRAKTLEGLQDRSKQVTIMKAGNQGYDVNGTQVDRGYRFIWAPEIHRVGNYWVIYFTESHSANTFDIYCHALVLDGDKDPYETALTSSGQASEWKDYKMVSEADSEIQSIERSFCLDMTYFKDETNGKSYVCWAGTPTAAYQGGNTDLFMATVDEARPWVLTSRQVRLTKSDYGWERVRYCVNEGATILQRGEDIFLCYSSSGTGSEYAIGMLSAKSGADLLDESSWTKSPYPVLTPRDVNGEEGPGHNSFTTDKDGNVIFVYHARPTSHNYKKCSWNGTSSKYNDDPLYDPCRHARLKRVHWAADGTPILKMTYDDELLAENKTISLQVKIGEGGAEKDTYTNPILNMCADPDILYYGGTYYLYPTNAGDANDDQGIKVYTSTDLAHWTEQGWAFKKGDGFGEQNFWAPDVIERDGTFYMYYVAEGQICVATSDSPLGPFKQDVKETMDTANDSYTSNEEIDAHVFYDEASEKYYFYCVRFTDGNVIWGAELNDDMKSIKKETLTEIVKADQGWDQDIWPVNEGPFMLVKDGKYYMTYSGSHFESIKYGVGYAVGDSPLGPFTKSEDNPIMQSGDQVHGAGHHCVTTSPDGKEMFIVYHCHHDLNTTEPRQLCIDRIQFATNENGETVLEVNGPTVTPQALPSGAVNADNFIQIEHGQFEDIKVDRNTPAEKLKLPEKVEIRTSKSGADATYEAAVKWDTTPYEQADGTVKEVTLNGTVVLPKGVSNLGNLPLDVKVKVQLEGEEEEEKDLLLKFTFDDEETGFKGGQAVAKPAGTIQDVDGRKALYLDGTNTNWLNVTKEDGSSLLAGVEEMTVSFDMKAVSGNWPFFAAPNANEQGFEQEHYVGIMTANNTLALERYNGGTRAPKIETGYTANEWTSVKIVLTKDHTQVYVNGEMKAEGDSDFTLQDILGYEGVLQIGKANWTPEGEYFTGYLDNYKITGKKAAVTKDALKEAIADAKALKETDYTKESWKAVADAVKAAEAVIAREDATQLEVNKAEETLDKAVKALKEVVKVDKSKLDAAVKAEKPAEDVDKYTKETWDAYQKALEAAKKVLADEKADQEAVDEAEKALTDAEAALKQSGLPFDDVAEGEWYYDAISYNYYAGTMTGLTPTHFGPSDTLVRAQFASVLHKMNGEVKMDYTDTFADVTEPDWFKDAVLWAAANEIVTGYTGTDLFGANDVVTREQMATMMYRYAKNFKKYEVSADGDCSKFPDAETIQPFAQEAMKWAVKEEIITGKTIDGVLLLDPQGSANRAECAMIIQRFLEKYEK